jgi:multiple sugar transport system substrate-binding protein
MKLGAAGIAAAILLSGCSTPGSSDSDTTAPVTQDQIDKAMDTPTTLEFWSWLPNMQNEVDLFEKKYPKIKVNLTNLGGGGPHYTKLRAAIAANQVPDVAQVEYQYISSYRANLTDLAPYGANDLKNDYVASVWGQISDGDKVFGLPQDIGPMGNLYRTDILEKAGVTPPTTWDEYAADAKTIKEKTGSYISNLPSSDAGQIIGLLQQGGAKPFSYDGDKTVGVHIDSPEAKKVMSYWNDLVKNDLVSTDTDFNDAWYQGLSNGKYAGWLTAAWGPVYLAGAAPTTSGLWQASKLPQWSAGDDVSGSWGGSSYAVMKGSKNQIAAYELTKFITHDPESSMMLATKQAEYPPLKSTLEDPAFADLKDPFFNGQQVNKLFAEIAPTVDQDFEWLPYMDFVYTSFNETLGKAIADKTDLVAGLEAWQKAVADYGTQQGFTVKQ